MITIDTGNRIIGWNRQAEVIFGWSRIEVIGRDLGESLEVAQLQGRWLAPEDRGGAGELLRGLVLAFGVDDLRPALALGLGLAGHRPLHRLGDLDVLDLDR